MTGQDRIRQQLRARGTSEAWEPGMVICCGHDLDVHDDDGCTVGWEPAATTSSKTPDECPCKVKGWAR